ncbi:MAG: UDP-3-O-acyl-N-acetylglucosamine deacetylase, partial [Alphaproteobacteria bacterium]|nr:UDP-3-O-acyl-N-acetylglucosamine deacetylase [Alphaproteobacteria bacterium]
MEKYQQKTIKHEISCVGIGLHTGNKISMTLK